MLTKTRTVAAILATIGVLVSLRIIALPEPLHSLLFFGFFLSIGAFALFRPKEVMAPIFSASQFSVWSLRLIGLVSVLIGLAGLIHLVAVTIGR